MNTSYEKWMKDLIFDETGYRELSAETLSSYQLKKIRQTINHAKKNRYYKEKLKNISSDDICSISDIKKIPFTTSEDLINNPYDFISVPVDEISRIVTLKTSGTTGNSKRIFFTDEDIQHTIEFFRLGMLNIVSPGQKVLILMPGNSPSSIGQLLKSGLDEAGCEGIIYGPVHNVYDVLEKIQSNNIDCIVGIPIQVFYMSQLKVLNPKYSDLKLKSILLSADYVPRSIVRAAGEAFNCDVFTHYGMTEMGYGGGVECSALNGYHMRDMDLYVEIIDPLTGKNTEEGEFGEVVFTTLRRTGMPLIRYRTGDISRFLPKSCSCNDALKRVDYVEGRISDCLNLKDGSIISMGMFDEIMFRIYNVLDYRASIKFGESTMLNIKVKPVNPEVPVNFNDIEYALNQDEFLKKAIQNNNIALSFEYINAEMEVSSGMVKRKLEIINKGER